MLNKILLVFLFSLLLSKQSVMAQPTTPPLATSVTVDLEKHTIGVIPFDKAFYLVGDVKRDWGIANIELKIKRGRDKDTPFDESIGRAPVHANNWFRLPFLNGTLEKDFLLPDRTYTIKVISEDANGKVIEQYSFEYGFISSSKLGDHTKLDIGVGYSPQIKGWFGMTSVNFYLAPFNDETDLQKIERFDRNILLRTGFFIGLSPLLFSSETEQPIKNKFGLGNFVYGIVIRSPFYGAYTPINNKVGQKVLQPMHLKLGWLLYKQADANLLIVQDRSKRSFFIGLTYDANILPLLGVIGKILQP
jgi:hypothetical protein